MPLWVALGGAVIALLWWLGARGPSRKEPSRMRPDLRHPKTFLRASSVVFLLGMLVRLGPARSWAMMGSLVAAWPALCQILGTLGWLPDATRPRPEEL